MALSMLHVDRVAFVPVSLLYMGVTRTRGVPPPPPTYAAAVTVEGTRLNTEPLG